MSGICNGKQVTHYVFLMHVPDIAQRVLETVVECVLGAW
jgi:hypothetical protein